MLDDAFPVGDLQVVDLGGAERLEADPLDGEALLAVVDERAVEVGLLPDGVAIDPVTWIGVEAPPLASGFTVQAVTPS